MSDYYKRLSTIDVKPFLEKKQNLDYLSWAHALHFLLSEDPQANWEVLPLQVMPDQTVMVWTSVTAFGITRKQWLPVMDHRNKAVPNPDAFIVNKNLQRCLVKNIAAFGLGLSVYAGEDLPENVQTRQEQEQGEYQAHLTAIEQAPDMVALQGIFKQAAHWGKAYPAYLEKLVAAKDTRKAQLEQAA